MLLWGRHELPLFFTQSVSIFWHIQIPSNYTLIKLCKNLWVLQVWSHQSFQAWLSAWGATVQGLLPLCGRQSAATWANWKGSSWTLVRCSKEGIERVSRDWNCWKIRTSNLFLFWWLDPWHLYCQAQKWQRERSTGCNIWQDSRLKRAVEDPSKTMQNLAKPWSRRPAKLLLTGLGKSET